ncbi:MAG: hypothetical protein HPY96_00560 [Bacilli bacterium]|nr:hypothetical protein [Bacilli bacterium]
MGDFVQIGVTALRNPDRSYMPSVKLYIEISNDVNEIELEKNMITDFAGICVKKYREYIQLKKENKEL